MPTAAHMAGTPPKSANRQEAGEFRRKIKKWEDKGCLYLASHVPEEKDQRLMYLTLLRDGRAVAANLELEQIEVQGRTVYNNRTGESLSVPLGYSY